MCWLNFNHHYLIRTGHVRSVSPFVLLSRRGKKVLRIDPRLRSDTIEYPPLRHKKEVSLLKLSQWLNALLVTPNGLRWDDGGTLPPFSRFTFVCSSFISFTSRARRCACVLGHEVQCSGPLRTLVLATCTVARRQTLVKSTDSCHDDGHLRPQLLPPAGEMSGRLSCVFVSPQSPSLAFFISLLLSLKTGPPLIWVYGHFWLFFCIIW